MTPPLSTALPASDFLGSVNRELLEHVILPNVFKPARYVGLEQGAYRKPFHKAAVTMAVAFPDLYEIGVSNYGLKLLYSLVNQHPDYMCDRTYAPAPDMKAKLAAHNMPLYAVESFVPLKQFDLLAFTLQYELNYTTILGMLESADIPFRSKDRLEGDYPLLIAGGPGSGNPMPLAPFFDIFIIGDGEEVLIEILDTIRASKKARWQKPRLLTELAKLQGVYIPGITPRADKRIIDIAEHPVDIAPLIPAIQAVHDRVVVEARRGCDRMCRFCQPCFINLPVREQSIERIKASALAEIEKTGYEECSLLSLSIADYSYFKPMILEVTEALEEEGISLSLPSQRADRFSVDVAEAVQRVRKSTLTFAPEAGTKRLRDVINKNLSDQEILDAVTSAYKTGWNKVKLYFIIGLPTETLDDLDGIVATVKLLQDACADIKRNPLLSIRKHLEVNVTLSNFVPKPHTPFQWFPQDTMDTLYGKIKYLKEQFRGFKGVKLNFTDPEISKLEAVISRGGPELSEILELAYRKGAYLDAWDDINNFQKWFDAIAELGPSLGIADCEQYTRERCCNPAEVLPWDPIDMGLNKSWLQDEYEKAKAEAATVPCFEACSTCGVCANYSTWPKFIETPKDLSKYEHAKEQAKKAELEKEADISASLAIDDSRRKSSGKGRNPARLHSDNHKLARLPVLKARLKVEKRDRLKFISHLDWLRMIYRAVSRAKIPVAYSQGFNPKPRISFSPALPLFSEAWGEYIDLDLTESLQDLNKHVKDALNAYLPEGGRVLSVEALPMQAASIDKSIKSLTYRGVLMPAGYPENPVPTAPEENSYNQATCQSPVKEYTEKDRLQALATHLQEKLAAHHDLLIEIPAGSGQPVNSLSANPYQTQPQLEPADCKKSLNLAPYLEDLRLLQDNIVEFRIRRLSPTQSSSQDNSIALASNAPEQATRTGAQAGPLTSIKPAWVLNLLNPPDPNFSQHFKWSLIRTEIELDSPSISPSISNNSQKPESKKA